MGSANTSGCDVMPETRDLICMSRNSVTRSEVQRQVWPNRKTFIEIRFLYVFVDD